MQAQNTKAGNGVCAARVVASTLGAIVGLAGINHGVFEILQGNVPPAGTMIEAIGPAQRFWEHGVETAFTLVPNLMVTGILSVILGIGVTLWAAARIDRRYGAWVFLLLGVALFLVGGGFGPIVTTLLAFLTATRIDKPLKGWRRLVPGSVLGLLGKTWRGALIAFVVLFVISVEIAIFGWPLTSFYDADTTLYILNTTAYVMLGCMVLAPLTALAHDARVQAERAAQT